MNLFSKTCELVNQIPYGSVSTFGAIARALGDVKASRAVSEILQHYSYDEAPVFRVIYSDGRVCSDGSVCAKHNRLNEEGIKIDNGIIDLNKYLFDDFITDYPLLRLKKQQNNLKMKIELFDDFDYLTAVGCDISYGYKAYGALVKMDIDGNVLNEKTVIKNIDFPYIPTYLSYREMPILKELLKGEKHGIALVDGNGILHPRGFGLACHIGVSLGIASIGVAKKKLCGTVVGNNVFIDNNKVAFKMKRLFISPGNKITLRSAISVVKKYIYYTNPEPLRRAHIMANEERKNNES